MKATKCPTDELSLMNRAIVNVSDFMHDDKWVVCCDDSIDDVICNKIDLYSPLMFCGLIDRYVDVCTGPGQHFIFAIERSPEVPQRAVGFSLLQRKWATLSINQDIDVKPFRFEGSGAEHVVCTVTLEVDFLQKKT